MMVKLCDVRYMCTCPYSNYVPGHIMPLGHASLTSPVTIQMERWPKRLDEPNHAMEQDMSLPLHDP